MLQDSNLIASFWVPGKPRSQLRPRAVRTLTGKVRVYSAGSAADWKAAIRAAAHRHTPASALDGPLAIVLRFYFKRPRRLWGDEHSIEAIPYTAKPDLDNLEKPVLDALTAAQWWRDDAQIVRLQSSKHYAPKELGAGVMVRIYRE